MSGTVTAPVVIHFEQEIVKMVVETRAHLENSRYRTQVSIELMETAPSYIARMANGVPEVVVNVRRSNALWSMDLEDAVRAEVETHRSSSGAPVRLVVNRT